MHAGGMVVCLGGKCHLALTKCVFDGCILLALDGSQVTINNAVFRGVEDTTNCYAITARGNGTKVNVHTLQVSAWAAVLVEHGAKFYGANMRFRDISFVAVHVRGVEAYVAVRDAYMRGRADRQPSAFQIATHAHVDIMRCTLVRFADGMHVMDGANVDASSCKISGCSARGAVAEDATLFLTKVIVEYAREKGIVVSGNDGRLEAVNCEVIQPRLAVCVSKGAAAKLEGCVLQGGLKGGLFVDGPQSFADCSACAFKANADAGVRVSGGARVHLRECMCNESFGGQSGPMSGGAAGMAGCGYVVQADSLLHAMEGVCRSLGPAPGCVVEATGRLEARNNTFTGRRGVLFLCQSNGDLAHCAVEDCTGNGMEVLSHVRVEAVRCTFQRCGGCGVAVRDDRRATLHEVMPPATIAAHVGLDAGDVPRVKAEEARGTCEMSRCNFSRNGEYGLAVTATETAVTTQDSRFQANRRGAHMWRPVRQ